MTPRSWRARAAALAAAGAFAAASAAAAGDVLVDYEAGRGETPRFASGCPAAESPVTDAEGISFDVPEQEKLGYGGRGVLFPFERGAVELGEGGTLTVEVVYSFEAENGDDWGLRLLALNTGGGLWTDRIHGFNDEQLAGWTAAGARAALGASMAKRCAAILRTGGGNNLLNAGDYKNLGLPVRQVAGLEPGHPHSAALVIKNEGGGRVVVSSSLGVAGVEGEYQAEGPVVFDAAGIFATRPCGKFAVRSFRVVYTAGR